MNNARAALHTLERTVQTLADTLERELPVAELAVAELRRVLPRWQQAELLLAALHEWRQILIGAQHELRRNSQIARAPSLFDAYQSLLSNPRSPMAPVRFLESYTQQHAFDEWLTALYLNSTSDSTGESE